MDQDKKISKKILLTLPDKAYKMLEIKAGKYGEKVTEYIRGIVLEDLKQDTELYHEFRRRNG
jgi:hypothetical protein